MPPAAATGVSAQAGGQGASDLPCPPASALCESLSHACTCEWGADRRKGDGQPFRGCPGFWRGGNDDVARTPFVVTDDSVSYQSTGVMVCEITGNAQNLRVFLSRSLVQTEYLSPV